METFNEITSVKELLQLIQKAKLNIVINFFDADNQLNISRIYQYMIYQKEGEEIERKHLRSHDIKKKGIYAFGKTSNIVDDNTLNDVLAYLLIEASSRSIIYIIIDGRKNYFIESAVDNFRTYSEKALSNYILEHMNFDLKE